MELSTLVENDQYAADFGPRALEMEEVLDAADGKVEEATVIHKKVLVNAALPPPPPPPPPSGGGGRGAGALPRCEMKLIPDKLTDEATPLEYNAWQPTATSTTR